MGSGWFRQCSCRQKNKDTAVLIVVGKVIHDRVFCGPTGNYTTNSKYGTLKTTKYQFTIRKPDQQVFAVEFDSAFKNLAKVQAGIAVTPQRQHFLIGENDRVNNIRFTVPVFEERSIVSGLFCCI